MILAILGPRQEYTSNTLYNFYKHFIYDYAMAHTRTGSVLCERTRHFSESSQLKGWWTRFDGRDPWLAHTKLGCEKAFYDVS